MTTMKNNTSFYTYIGKYGNKILWRGYEDGKPFLRDIKYKPTLFIPTKETTSEYTSFIGQRPLKPKQFDSMSDANDFIEQYKDVNGFEIHGNSNFVAAFTQENYPDSIEFDENLINLFNFDIETDISDGYPDMQKCDKPITSIALKYRKSDKYILLGQKHYDRHKTLTDIDPDNIVYEKFNSEKDLLRRFVEIWCSDYPEVVTGWNCIPINSNIWLKDRIKSLESINQGDKLYDSEVVKVSPVSKKMPNEMRFTNGAVTIASDDHIFPVVAVQKGKYIKPDRISPHIPVDMTVDEIKKVMVDNHVYISQPLRENTNSSLSWYDLFAENVDVMKRKGVVYKSIDSETVTVSIKSMSDSPQSLQKLDKNSSYTFNKSDIITTDEMWLSGLIYADGSSSTNSLTMCIYNNDESVIDESVRIVIERFRHDIKHEKGSPVSWKFRKGNNSARVRFSLTKAWILKTFMYDEVYGSYKKKLDITLMSMLSANQFSAFMGGVIDGDGSVNENGTSTMCVFNGDDGTIRELCFWNGVFASIQNKTNIRFWKNNFHLYIRHSNKMLRENINEFMRTSSSNDLRWFSSPDGVYVRLNDIQQMEDPVEMMDMETSTHYFVANGVRTHNCIYFDIWYTFTRIATLFGENTLKRMSPWGVIKQTSKEIYGKKNSTYDIMGISLVDYMDAFKKFGYKYGTQETYKLDHIAHVVLGESKLSYERFGTKIDTHRFITDGAKNVKIPDDVPDDDLDEKELLVRRRDVLLDELKKSPDDLNRKEMYQKYVKLADDAYYHFGLDYNLKDTRIVEMLEDETSMLSLVFAVAYRGGSNFKDAFGTVGIWDTTLYRKIRLEGMVPPIKKTSGNESSDYVGGYVKDPQVGLHEWVVSFDLNSLYPNIFLQFNMSPETIIGNDFDVVQKALLRKATDSDVIRYLNSKQFLEDFMTFNSDVVLADEVPNMLKRALIDTNTTISANRTVFDCDTRGIIPSIIDEYYGERKKIKKEMLSVESELELVKDELKRRSILKKNAIEDYRGDRKRYKL